MNLGRYQQLVRDSEEAKRKRDRLAGSLDSLYIQLKEEFGCKSLTEAEALLAKWEVVEEEAKREYERLLRDYEREYGSKGDD